MTRRAALVAEVEASVGAELARAEAELPVQNRSGSSRSPNSCKPMWSHRRNRNVKR